MCAVEPQFISIFIPQKRLLVYLGLFLTMSMFGRLTFLGKEHAGG